MEITKFYYKIINRKKNGPHQVRSSTPDVSPQSYPKGISVDAKSKFTCYVFAKFSSIQEIKYLFVMFNSSSESTEFAARNSVGTQLGGEN